MNDNTILLRAGLTAEGDIDREGAASVFIKGLDNTNTRIVLSLSKEELDALVKLCAEEQVELDKITEELKEENPE